MHCEEQLWGYETYFRQKGEHNLEREYAQVYKKVMEQTAAEIYLILEAVLLFLPNMLVPIPFSNVFYLESLLLKHNFSNFAGIYGII